MSANLYDRDFHAWTQDQAGKLKAGRLSELDIAHLTEELESIGATERREVVHRLAVLMAHLLKWQFQQDRRGRSWELTIIGQRLETEDVLDENPSLRPRLGEFFGKAYRLARVEAAKEIGMDLKQFPKEPPFTVEEVLGSEFWPNG